MSAAISRPLSGLSILIVDDEDLVREVACMIITENGGEALAAGDSGDALDVLASNPVVSCILLDYSMPGLNGYGTFLEFEKVRPGLPTVIFSGLTVVPEVAELQNAGRVTFLAKPFGEIDLVEAIRRAVGRS